MPSQTYHSLQKPPIKVVIFELLFNSSLQKFPPENHAILNELYKPWFSEAKHNVNTNLDFKNSSGGQTTVTVGKPEINILRYHSQDKTQLLSIASGRFSITVNNSYSRWEDYIAILKDTWDIYRKTFLNNELTITRISTRFINRIEITDMVSPSDYFNTTIYASDKVIPGTIGSFLMQFVSTIPEEKIDIKVVQGFEPRIGNISPYVFDIDVLCTTQLNEDNIWNVFNRLREIKNTTFFNNLTDKTLSLLS